MPVYQLDPDARVSKVASWTRTGGSSLPGVLSDSDDATYARSNTKNLRCTFSTTDPASPQGALVSVCPFVRSKRPGTLAAKATVCTYMLGKIISRGGALTIPRSDAIGDHELPAHRGCHDLGWVYLYERPDIDATRYVYPLTAAEAAIGLVDPSATDNRATVYEAGLKAYYLLAPTVAAPSAPAGTVTTTQRPDCTVEVGCVVESWQLPDGEAPWLCDGDVTFRVYAAADVPDGATTPPPLALPLWVAYARFIEMTYGDGVTPSTQDVTLTPDVALPNGDYVLFARASRDLPKGTRQHWSAWSSAEFTVDIALPTTPELAVAANDAAQRMDLSIEVSTTAGYNGDAMTATVERSDDGGVTWVTVRGCDGAAVVEGSNTLEPDYEAPRGQDVIYRAYITDVLTADDLEIASDWHTPAALTAYAVAGWNLKAPADPTLNWLGAPILADPEAQLEQEVGIFRPLGRGSAVAISGASSGEAGTYEVYAKGATEIAQLEELIEHDGALYVENAYGEALYVRITQPAWILQGTEDSPRRQASLAWVEVGRPS